GAGLALGSLSTLPPLGAGAVLMFLGMGMLGMGNGAVFQLVPQRFPKEIGVVTGIVGAAGGLGGFFLPNLLGSVKQLSGTFAYAFLIFAIAALGCGAALGYASRAWQGVFVGRGGMATTRTVEGGEEAPAEGTLAGVEASA